VDRVGAAPRPADRRRRGELREVGAQVLRPTGRFCKLYARSARSRRCRIERGGGNWPCEASATRCSIDTERPRCQVQRERLRPGPADVDVSELERSLPVYVTALVCTHCGAEHPLDARLNCDTCLGPVEPSYDYEAIARTLTREKIEAGPRTLWRYLDLLP